jgi:hypothetical protein
MIDDLMSHPYLSLGAIVVGIAAVCAIIAILRGVFRLIIHTAMLTCAIWVAYRIWIFAPAWGSTWSPHPPSWLPYVIPTIAGTVTLLTLRKLYQFLSSPLQFLKGKPVSSPGKWISVSLSLIPTALLCLIAALLIRHLGTLRQVEDPTTRSISVLWKDVIDRYIPPVWLQRIDPITDPLRLTLVQWMSFSGGSSTPRAVPVSDPQALDSSWINDPKWRELLEQKRYGEILRDPQLEQALRDPRLQKVLLELRQQLSP